MMGCLALLNIGFFKRGDPVWTFFEMRLRVTPKSCE